MKIKILLFCFFPFFVFSQLNSKRFTTVSIKQNQFYINHELTYKGRYWKGNKIEGLLMNSRMVQGIFDDENSLTNYNFFYSDTQKWDPERNANEFIQNMASWKSYGLLAFTLNLQGGSPYGYGNKGSINTAFDLYGNLKKAYLKRLESILNKADQLGMVVILGYFYFGQDQHLKNGKAVLKAVDNITNWLVFKKYKNVIIEVNNECDIYYDHNILKKERVYDLIKKVKKISRNKLLVSTSFSGGTLPTLEVMKTADFVLLHANGVKEQDKLLKLILDTKNMKGFNNKPIIINEDDHFNFEKDENNFLTSVKNYVSWGYFDYRMKGESFENGYQTIPVDWGVNSTRKKSFFEKLKEVTGY